MNTTTVTVSDIVSVSKMSAKTGKPFQIYSIVGTDGNNYEYGFKSPPVSRGQTYDITYKVEYGKNKITDLLPIGTAPAAPASRTTTKASYTERTFPVNISSPEMSIIRQSALKAAIDLYNTHSVDGDLTLENHAEAVITLAYKFADFSSGQREVNIAVNGDPSNE
jgi:hypothetical protein